MLAVIAVVFLFVLFVVLAVFMNYEPRHYVWLKSDTPAPKKLVVVGKNPRFPVLHPARIYTETMYTLLTHVHSWSTETRPLVYALHKVESALYENYKAHLFTMDPGKDVSLPIQQRFNDSVSYMKYNRTKILRKIKSEQFTRFWRNHETTSDTESSPQQESHEDVDTGGSYAGGHCMVGLSCDVLPKAKRDSNISESVVDNVGSGTEPDNKLPA